MIGESGHVLEGRIVRTKRFSQKRQDVSAPSTGCLGAITRPTVDAIRRRDSVARFDVRRVFLFFERLMYILMCYRNVLYLLNCKLLFRLAIVILLGCCEFNPNVTVRENSRLLTNRHTTCWRGVIGGFGQREVGMLRTASVDREETEGGISTR